MVLLRRELADHRVSDRRDEQLTDALQHVAREQPHERTLAICAGQFDAERQNEKGERHQQQRRRELLRYVDSPSLRTHAGEERREHRAAEHDANGVDVLNPLRLNLHGTDHQVDVVDREQHQAARRHLVERPEHQRADGQNQISRHVPLLAAIRVADREVDQRYRDRTANRLDQRLGSAGPLEHEPYNGDEPDENTDPGELAQPELLRRFVEQWRIAVGQRFPVEEGEDDGDEIAERREDEETRVALGSLEMACDAEPDKEADVHTGVVPEEGSFAARILRSEALGQHHVDAGDVEAAAGEEQGEADVEQRERAGRDAGAADHLQRHASDKQVPVRQEAAAQVTAEEVQAVVEGAEHAHQRGGLFHAEMQMLRRVENQGRVEDSEAQRREDLNEEQRSRSLRGRGEKTRFDEAAAHHLRSLPRELDRPCRLIPVGFIDSFTPVHSALQLAHLSRSTPVSSIHHALLCRSTRRVMSSGSQARTLRREAASLFASWSREADDSVLVNGARGTRDIEGKVTRVGASELGCERVSKPRAPAMLAALDLQRVEENAFHLVDEGQRTSAGSVARSSEEDKDCFGKLPKPTQLLGTTFDEYSTFWLLSSSWVLPRISAETRHGEQVWTLQQNASTQPVRLRSGQAYWQLQHYVFA